MLEPKINDMVANKSDNELTNNKRFNDRVELLVLCYIKIINIVVESKQIAKSAAEYQNHALSLAVRFLGENHSLTNKLSSIKNGVSVNPRKVSGGSNRSSSRRSVDSMKFPMDSSLHDIGSD